MMFNKREDNLVNSLHKTKWDEACEHLWQHSYTWLVFSRSRYLLL